MIVQLILSKSKSNFFKLNRTAEKDVEFRLLIGNPGVGKSTLANCIAKTVLFKSGVNFGKGMTCQLDENVYEGITYLDTPGLADIKMRKTAAKAITEGLKKGGIYQIFFVVTLEAGRLRPTDLATIKIVLRNAKEITSYSLIINKLSKRVHDHFLENNGKEVENLASELNFQVGKNRMPPNLFLLLSNPKLYDAENKFMKLDHLDEFVASAPCVTLTPNNIKDIPGDNNSFEETVVSVTEELNQLRNDKERMIKQIKETKEKYKKLAAEVKLFQFLHLLS